MDVLYNDVLGSVLDSNTLSTDDRVLANTDQGLVRSDDDGLGGSLVVCNLCGRRGVAPGTSGDGVLSFRTTFL